MNSPVVFALRIAPILAGVALLVTYFVWGPLGALGGVIGVTLSWSSLWLGKRFMTGFDEKQSKLSGVARLQLLLLVKMPILVVVTFFTNSLGLGAVSGFLTGYLLVYLALAFGALFGSSPPANTDDPQ
jgi:hypothetical protein